MAMAPLSELGGSWSNQKSLPNPDGWESQFFPKLGTLWIPLPQSENLNMVKFPDTDTGEILGHSIPEKARIMQGEFSPTTLNLGVPAVASIMRMQVRSLASLSGLRIWCCRELWCRLQFQSDP